MNNPIAPTIRRYFEPCLLAFALLQLVGCSEQTNPLGYIAKPWAEADAAAYLSRSEILLDEGAYEEALEAAEHAFRLAPLQTRVATQLSYAHLSAAGLDLFQLAKKMLNKGDEATADPEVAALILAEENAAGQLSSLADLVGLQASDYEAITLPGNRQGDLEGAPASGPFRDLPILLPKTAIEARAGDSPTLGHIARAISVICNFMPDELMILGDNGDPRHTDPSCEIGERQTARDGKALFVWAIAHLIEAVAFHQVVLYQPTGSSPHLVQRSAALAALGQGTSIAAYVQAVDDLASVVSVVMPTSPELARGSMLAAMFNDLETVSNTFARMPGIPAKLSGGFIRALSQLKEQRGKLNTGSAVDGSSVVLKDQLTSGLAAELKKQIESKDQAGELSAKDKSDVCEAYQSISSEALSLCTAS